MANIVFIAVSLDGYIADKQGSLEWLDAIPNPDNVDTGFGCLINRVDAVVMGRKTFDVVAGFSGEWPYTKPVFVVSKTLTQLPNGYENKATLINGTPTFIVSHLAEKGFTKLYIDGGTTIQHFLAADLIDEMVITQFPILLGGGSPLFGALVQPLYFNVSKSEVVLDNLVQTTFLREKT
ncbi:dihydrofolate reductase family protein [Alteromonas sp. KUL49]|uniref:dihydrofolate reductase family protein n=1 Tax=Alteromonas sp. KUL49 TaxID=2480798 RepID=UPI00102EE49F|nr:dihydrofolate reductase family protein [Alteromonas sp. KUL49]TAP35510.1 dihydrofolate reductase [Alteromonas sp. KUL49]GEA13389.1 diacylglycerol kinase [Alteromonas sp. KUL49]